MILAGLAFRGQRVSKRRAFSSPCAASLSRGLVRLHPPKFTADRLAWTTCIFSIEAGPSQCQQPDPSPADPTARNSAAAEDMRPIYERRLAERNRALERCTRRDRRVADARLAAFVVLVVLGFLIVRGVAISALVAGMSRMQFSSRSVLVHEPDPPRRRPCPSLRAVLLERAGSTRRTLAGHRLIRDVVSERRSPVCRRPRPVRHRFALRAAMHGENAIGRGHAGRLAARSGEPRGDGRAPRGRSRAAPAARPARRPRAARRRRSPGNRSRCAR